ncbi:hypothetical protein [Albidovulum sp.]|uniref:hypothetical protein n=1 Tax=Albidovulum sp. TaxID=1872424 RepID=UPI0039B92BD6
MASAQGALPALLFISALFLVPPAVSLAAGFRRVVDLRRRGVTPGRWLRAATAFSAGAMAINLVVIAATLWTLGDGGLTLGPGHAIAALLSWFCFGIWVAVLIFGRRRRRRTAY